jgi:hypothetical protein
MEYDKPHGATALIPVLRPESAQHFVDPSDVEPQAINDNLTTSALRVGVRLDLLGISTTDETDNTDCIDPAIALAKIYYRTKSGMVHEVDVSDMPYNAFVPACQGNYRDVTVNMSLEVSMLGEPTTWLGKLGKKIAMWVDGDPKVLLRFTGVAKLQMGTIQVDAVSDHPDVTPIGYTLSASRINMNRRPRSCPAM